MTIEEMKKRKTELGLTSEMVSKMSGIPLGTVQKIFAGTTKAPRRVTIAALEKVLAPSASSGSDAASTCAASAYAASTDAASTYPANESPDRYDSCSPRKAGILHESSPFSSAGSAKKVYTLDDYYALPDERRAELIDGVFYDMTAPSAIHQLILGQLYRLFSDCAEQHDMPFEVIMAPFDVHLDRDDYTMVQPDLLIVCSPQDFLQLERLEGAPDLAVEILSPSSRSKDMILKLYKYKRAGVREYWIVDPKYRTVTVHCFDPDEDYDPRKYSFREQVPIGISGGSCTIDLSRIQERLARYERV